MKINVLMGFIALSFFTVAGFFGAEYYQNITAMQHGLRQCQVWNPDHSHYDVMWQDHCEG